MSFIEDLVQEMGKVQLYTVEDKGENFKAIRCETVCAIITTLFDKYNLEESINNDLHG